MKHLNLPDGVTLYDVDPPPVRERDEAEAADEVYDRMVDDRLTEVKSDE